MPTRTLTILGSTGSIGTNTLDVVRQNPDRFSVFALAAGRNIDLLAQQIQEFKPEGGGRCRTLPTWIACAHCFPAIPNRDPELLSGPDALIRIAVAPEVDTVMSSIVGVAGLAGDLRGGLRRQTGRPGQ